MSHREKDPLRLLTDAEHAALTQQGLTIKPTLLDQSPPLRMLLVLDNLGTGR